MQPGDLIRTYQDDKDVWQLAQLPNVKAAFVALEPDDGALVSLVGGYDYNLSKFINVTQAENASLGLLSSHLFTLPLWKSYSSECVNDAPITKVDASNENIWRPKNSSGNYKGPTRLRKALSSSTNLVSDSVS